MALQRNAERRGRRLAGVIVRCRADAAEAEDQIAAGKRAAQDVRQPRAIVAEVLRVSEREPALAERLDDVRKMLVLPLAGQELVADDQRADGRRRRGTVA